MRETSRYARRRATGRPCRRSRDADRSSGVRSRVDVCELAREVVLEEQLVVLGFEQVLEGRRGRRLSRGVLDVRPSRHAAARLALAAGRGARTRTAARRPTAATNMAIPNAAFSVGGVSAWPDPFPVQRQRSTARRRTCGQHERETLAVRREADGGQDGVRRDGDLALGATGDRLQGEGERRPRHLLHAVCARVDPKSASRSIGCDSSAIVNHAAAMRARGSSGRG